MTNPSCKAQAKAKLPEGVLGFHELLEIILPRGLGAVVILKAFFDASSRPKTKVFCLAGFAFRKLQLQKFDRDWWRLFGRYGGCHMKELAHRTGRFGGIDDIEQRRLIKEAVAILQKRACYGLVVSCWKHEVHAVLPRWVKGFEGAYPLCSHMAMTMLGARIRRSGADDRAAYVFESGDEYSGSAHEFMNRAEKSPEVMESYRHYSHSFVQKKDALALQAADLLAWECAKFLEETLAQRIRPMRLSLAHLLADKRTGDLDSRFSFAHLTGEPLRKFANHVRRLATEQQDEKAARGRDCHTEDQNGTEEREV